MRCLILLSLLACSVSGFVLPFRLVQESATTNITRGGQTLEQTSAYFVANLTIGSTAQLFTVVVDTSSADLIVPDISCPSVKTTDSCYGKRKFNSAVSSSYKKLDNQNYGASNNLGKFVGITGQETVVIGDRKTDLITVTNLKFLQSQAIGSVLRTLKADGILGLAFSSKSQIKGESPFVQAVKQGDVQDSFFSIWLEHYNQTNDLGTHGVIYYGGLDPVHCAPNAQYFPLSAVGFYQATVVSFASMSTKTNTISQPIQAILDSTYPYIGLTSKYLSSVLTSIGQSITTTTQFPVPVSCSLKITLKFSFAGATATITERDLVTNSANGCVLNVAPSDTFKIGVPFLRGRCTYFDVVRQRIGVTPALLQD